MNRQNATARNETSLPLPARRHPIIIGLLLLPVSILIAIAATVSAQPQMEPSLLALIVLLGFSQLALICLALQHIFSAELVMDGETLTIKKFMNTETYAWRDIAKIDVTPATGTLLDNPFCPMEQRIGVGLIMHGSEKSSKDATADVIVAACDTSHTIRMMQLAERIQQFQYSLSSPSARRLPLRAKQANQKTQFTSRQTTATVL
ncbi:MAG: hypothetical protein AAGD43_29890 [Pseudomonadota bacterium]